MRWVTDGVFAQLTRVSRPLVECLTGPFNGAGFFVRSAQTGPLCAHFGEGGEVDLPAAAGGIADVEAGHINGGQ